MGGEDLSKYAPMRLIPCISNVRLVYVPALSWAYHEGSYIVLDVEKFKEFVESFIPLYPPLQLPDDERKEIINNFIHCNKFYLYPNFEYVERGKDYDIVERENDGVLFKVRGYAFRIILEELASEGRLNLCEFFNIYVARRINDKMLDPEDLEKLRKDFDTYFDEIFAGYVEACVPGIGALANEAGLIIIKEGS